jgi:cell surface protein SprA
MLTKKVSLYTCTGFLWLFLVVMGLEPAYAQRKPAPKNQKGKSATPKPTNRTNKPAPERANPAPQPADPTALEADTTDIDDGVDTTQLGSGKESRPVGLPFYLRDRYNIYSGFGAGFRQRQSPFLLGLPNKKYADLPPFTLTFPGIETKVEYQMDSGRYRISEQVAGQDVRPPVTLDEPAMRRIRDAEARREVFRDLNREEEGSDPTKLSGRIIQPIKLPPLANRLFGGSELDIQPVGSILLDIGGRWQRIDNPQILRRQQRNGGLFFDQQIQLNLVGKIGKKLNLNFNWDTKNTFQFDNRFLSGYTAQEEDIVQEVNIGNVSMPVSNSLIQGAQNIFGVRTRLRFGNLWINAVASQQRGTVETMRIKGGAQQRGFEIRADSYEENRHFFLAQFFRQNYEGSLRTMPVVTSGVVVTRLEVYVTNRNNNTSTLRNVVGLQDLGEGVPFRPNNPVVGPGRGAGQPAANANNELFRNAAQNPLVRDVDQLTGVMERSYGFVKGADYELLRGARRLTPQSEYTFHANLGYLSLTQPLRNDEIIAVSFEYTYNGQTYQVGELTESYQNRGPNEVIVLKLLRPSTIRTDLPTWDLMMKNIYSLQTQNVERANFQLRVVYRDDLTGIDNPSLHEGARTKDLPLVQLMNLDRLNQNTDPQPDGNFDFVEGVTVDSRNGRIIFPVVEPFGRHLESYFEVPLEQQLINKYVFNELYRGTRADAILNTAKSKFFIRGSSQSASGTEVRLNGINISPNSVQIRAGGAVLQEGMDYNVDYLAGTVRITNTGVMSSGKEIVIQYERADLFNFQTRNLVGTDLEYRLSKDIRLTGTLMHLNERPNISRVSIGAEPTRNTMLGLGVGVRKESRLLTRLIDKLPLISTKAPSSIVFSTDFAKIIPGANRLVRKDGGTYFVDDFEAAEIPYDLTRQPQTWSLGSTPLPFRNPTAPNPLEYAFRRAKMAWYTVDNTVFDQAGLGQSRPPNLAATDLCNHYVRTIRFNEILQGRDAQQLNNPEMTLNLAYYPNERGMYNYNPNLNADGTLPNPRQNYAGITKAITYDIDFDNINIQYIEFWLLDPFIQGPNGQVIVQRDGRNVGINNNTGGKLLFNLGNISEDYVPDGRHGFENGLPANDGQANVTQDTPWGRVTNQQYLTNAFAAEPGARGRQDVGLDGLSDEQERGFFTNYLNAVRGRVNANVFEQIQNDPSGDNFQFYLGSNLDSRDAKIFDRYYNFNGMEGNSPEGGGTASSSFLPDNEDLNRDNSLNDIDAYYEYEIDMRPGQLGRSPYVVDRISVVPRRAGSSTSPCPEEEVNWYLFRIPIRDFQRKFGGINDFKSIRFLRMYMTDWQQPVVMRMAHFQLVGTQWRPFTEDIAPPGLNLPREPYRPTVTVSSVNVEENGPDRTEAGRTPYDLPPGFERDVNLASNTNARFNEQSLRMCVDNLADRDARAIYKNAVLDMVNYQRIKMFIHAENTSNTNSLQTRDGEMTVFMRFGTDFKENYYEVEVPVVITPPGASDPASIWPAENEIDIAIQDLIQAKAERNRQRLSLRMPYISTVDRFRITIMGNPDISSVQTMMIGIRNPETDDELPKSLCIWVNELRVTGFVNQGGWAVQSRLQAQLADLAQVNGSLRYSSPFFGGIQDKLSARTRDHSLEYDISTSVRLDKFFLERLGFSIPMFFSLERRLVTPYFNPLDPDTPLNLSVDSREDGALIRSIVRDNTERRSINFTNVRKIKTRAGAKAHLWDVENLAFNFSHAELRNTSIRTAEYSERFTRVGLLYNYQNQSPALEPFKNVVLFNSPNLKFLKEFNINPLPTSITVSGDVDRRFVKTQLRSADLTTLGIQPLYEKSFTFNRAYNIRWGLSRNLNLDYNAQAFSIIDEPLGEINSELVDRNRGVTRRDSVLTNLLRLGRMKNYVQQVGLQYRLPFDKFPMTEWMQGDVSYRGGYQWTAGAVGIADSLGNNMQNNNSLQLNGQADFRRLYDKSEFLRRINNPGRAGTQPQPILKGEARKQRLQNRLRRLDERKRYWQGDKSAGTSATDAMAPPGVGMPALGGPGLANVDSATYARALNRIVKYENKIQELIFDTLKYGKRIDRYERKILKLRRKIEPVPDTLQDPPKPLDSAKAARKIAKIDERVARINEIIAEINQKQEEQRTKGQTKDAGGATKALARLLMSVQRVRVDYRATNQSMVPGVLFAPRMLGMDQNMTSPGFGYVFGAQNPNILNQLAANGAVSRSPLQNNSYMQGRMIDLGFQATVSPVRDFDWQLKASKRSTGNYSEVFRFNVAQQSFDSQTPVRNGSYEITYSILRTLFARDDENNNSPLFNNYIQNRAVVKGRLDDLNPVATDYDLNSQDVVIPAFLAAYSGRDAGSQRLSAFPAIPVPNWTLTYSGLTNVAFIKQVFNSVQIQSNYDSRYQVGNYTSSLLYSPADVNLGIREQDLPLAILDPSTGALVPVFVMNQVNITEAFNPLIGVNARTLSGLNINVRYNVTRNIGLNLNNAQVTELRNEGITLDVGFQKAGVKIPFKIQGGYKVLKNDLQFRMAFTVNDTRTIQRRIGPNDQQEAIATAGNLNLQLKPTLNYVVNQQLSLQFYFDRLINAPLISNSFRRTSTAFGVQIRYNLAAQ